MKVRKLAKKDLKDVSDLIRRNLREVNIKDYDKNIIDKLCIKYSPEGLKKLAGKRPFFVVEQDDEILGVCSLDANEALSVYVRTDMHGKGVGSKMMRFLEDYCKKESYSKIHLPSSVTAYEFYKKLGYEKIKELNKHGVREIVMEKKLS